MAKAGVAIFDLDFDAILAAMYAVDTSVAGDCYLCVPPDPGIEAAALGGGEAAAHGSIASAAPGASAFAAPGAGESALPGTTSAQAFHTFTLDSTTSGTLSSLYLPSFSTNLVSGADLQDRGVESPAAAESAQVAALSQMFAAASRSGPQSAPCSCRLLSHQTLLWHHRLGYPSLPRPRGMASCVLVSDLPRSLPPLPPGPGPTCVPCVDGRQRAAPHSSEFPPTQAPMQTLHMDVSGQGREQYILLVVDDYSRYTTVFPLRSKDDITKVLIDWIRAARLQLRDSFGLDFLVLRLHSDRGGEFSCACLGAFCRAQGIRQTFTLPASPQQNGIAERRIGMVIYVARTSMMHAASPNFLRPFAVHYAAHQLNLQPRVSLLETFPALRWTGKVGDASAFRVWGSRVFVRDLSTDKLSHRVVPCVFLGCPPDAPGWQFYHPTSRRDLSSQDVNFDVSVDAIEPVEVAVDSGDARGAEPAGARSRGARSGGAQTRGAEPGVARNAGSTIVAAGGASSRREPLSPQELREWFARRWRRAAESGGAAGATKVGPAGAAVGAGAAGGGASRGVGAGVSTGARASGGATEAAGADGPTGVGAAGVGAARGVGVGGVAGAGASKGAGVGAVGARGAAGAGAAARGTGAVLAGSGGAERPRPYFVPLLEQVLGLPPSPGPAPPLECPQPVHSQSQLKPASPLPAPSPYTGSTGGLAERRWPASHPALPVRAARTSHRATRPRPSAVPSTHQMALHLSISPRRVPLPSPPESSLPSLADPESKFLRAASPSVTRLLATVVTDPSFESTAASALVAQLVDFAARCRLDNAASLVAESESVCPLSVEGECALSTHVFEDRQEEFQCFAAALPHLVSTLIAPKGDPDAPDIPTPRSYAEAIEGPYSSQWLSAMDAEMASWKSRGTYVDEVPPLGANIVSGMWIFRVKRPPRSPPVFKARYVARGFSQRQGVDYFQTFSSTPKMTTLRVLLHIAAQHDYELHSLDFPIRGRAVDFEVWVDDLQLFLQCNRGDGLSLFDLTSRASPAPAADANATVRSQWATRVAGARLAVRRHLLTTERAHFSQYKSAQTLYDAVVARYSSPATAALSRLMLPYLFPDLPAFPTVADLITHLRTSDTRYHAALPAEFYTNNPHPPPPHVHHPLLHSHPAP
ncbi:unnamed protein product [Closterium sp. NIES-65]|nr:unnamed protein product [Closterium sp. NIES-65]